MSAQDAVLTVIEVTYINTTEGAAPEWIGVWYTDGRRAQLVLQALDRIDLLALEKGDKGRLTRNGDKLDFQSLGN